MNNLKKFATEADYSAATLNYPAVSWVTATDNVHFDKGGSPTPTVNDKVMMAWHSPSDVPSGKDIVIWHTNSTEPTSLFDSLTINDIDLMLTIGGDGVLHNYSQPDTDYLVKYDLINDTTITDIFVGDLGGGWGSSAGNVDFLIPSQVTDIQSIPNNVGKLVIEVATPPTTSLDWSAFTPMVYVPDNAVSVYQSAWNAISSNIHPISEYQGNLPV
jgi:hypothetical protein